MLTDCIKCWETPCVCGYADGRNTLSREETIDMINKLIKECEYFWEMEGIGGSDDLDRYIKTYKEKGII